MAKLTGETVLMRIFIGERDRYENRPLHEALVEIFKRQGFAGATVLRGVAGFGAHSIFHTDRILRLSRTCRSSWRWWKPRKSWTR